MWQGTGQSCPNTVMGCAGGKVKKTCLGTNPSDLPAKAPRSLLGDRHCPQGHTRAGAMQRPAGVCREHWAVPAGPAAAPGPCPPSWLVPRRHAGLGTAPRTPGTGPCPGTGCASPAKGTALQSSGGNNPAAGGTISSSSQALGHFSLPRAPAADSIQQRARTRHLPAPAPLACGHCPLATTISRSCLFSTCCRISAGNTQLNCGSVANF